MNLSSRELAREPRPHHPLPPPKRHQTGVLKFAGKHTSAHLGTSCPPSLQSSCCTTHVQSSEDRTHDLAPSTQDRTPEATNLHSKLSLGAVLGALGPSGILFKELARREIVPHGKQGRGIILLLELFRVFEPVFRDFHNFLRVLRFPVEFSFPQIAILRPLAPEIAPTDNPGANRPFRSRSFTNLVLKSRGRNAKQASLLFFSREVTA